MTAKRLTLVLLALAACASQPGTAGSSSAARTVTAPLRDRNILSRDEILRGEYQSAFDAVLALRRTWILDRPADRIREPTPVLVYLDEMKLGGIDELRSIAIGRIAQIKYFDGTTAYARWGLGHDRGVVQVITIVPTAPRP